MRILRNITFALTAIAFVAYFVAFGSLGGVQGVLFLLPFTMVPFLVTALLALRWQSLGSQTVLLATTVAYAVWFTYVYLDATVLHPDPQSPIAFLFVGIYATPILILLWILAWAIDWERKGRWAQ